MNKWSASSLDTAQVCPRKYQLSYVELLTDVKPATAMEFGSAFHLFQEKLATSSVEDAKREVRNNYQFAETLYNDDNLDRLIDGYLEFYKDDMLDVTQAEYWWALPIGIKIDGEDVLFRGVFDAIAQWKGELCVVDYKTTGRKISPSFVSAMRNKSQMLLYSIVKDEVAGGPSKLVLDFSQVLKTKTDYQREYVHISDESKTEFVENAHAVIETIGEYEKKGYYPKHTTQCAMCHFKNLCEFPTNSGIYQHILKTQYKKKETRR